MIYSHVSKDEIGIILLPITIGSVYAECSEQDRDACIGSDGKFDYDAYEDSFWESVKIQHSFEKNSLFFVRNEF